MKKPRYLITSTFILFLGIVTTSFASDQNRCQPVDLRSDPRLPPIRTQGDVQWCYVVAAADLLSFYVGRNLSYLDLALSVNSAKKQIDFGPGRTEDVLAYAQSHLLCDERDLPANSSGLSIFKLREQLIEIEKDQKSLNKNCQIDEQLATVRSIFASTHLNDLLKAQGRSHSGSQFVDILDRASCHHKPLGQHFYIESPHHAPHASEIIAAIDAQLSDKAPIAISYDISMIRDASHGGHESTLIGRRFNAETQTCEYLLRNSGGTACQNADGSTYYRPGLNCEQGNVWIPQQMIARQAMGYVYVRTSATIASRGRGRRAR